MRELFLIASLPLRWRMPIGLYHAILCRTMLYHTTVNYTIRYYTIQYPIILTLITEASDDELVLSVSCFVCE